MPARTATATAGEAVGRAIGEGNVMVSKRLSGFSLIELMVTIFVLAILLALAVPNFRGVMQRSKVTSANNQLVADLQYARGEAVTRHTFVSLCRSTDGASCATSSSDSSYDIGWLVYSYNADTDGANQDFNTSKADHQLLRSTPLQRGVAIMATDGEVLTFSQSGKLVKNGARTKDEFVTCFRPPSSDTGPGSNTNETHGTHINVLESGSVSSNALAAGAGCSP
jgi:type IV fimbrial biogenesis protein FimT